MRSKLFLMGMVFILCALLLNLGYSTESVKAQEKHSLTVVLKPGVGFSAEGMDSVYGHIESVQNELLKLNFDGVIKETDPVAIANFFGDTGAMVKYDGTLAKGQKDIEDYLKEKKGHIEDMKIRLEVHLCGRVDPHIEQTGKRRKRHSPYRIPFLLMRL